MLLKSAYFKNLTRAFASSFLLFSFGTCTYTMLPNTLKCRKFGFVPKYSSCADTSSLIRF